MTDDDGNGLLDAFSTPITRAPVPRMGGGRETRRHRLKRATATVVREAGAHSPRILSDPDAVAELARDLVQATDDDKEHFWAILLNTQNHYLMHTLVSTGTMS